MLDDTLNTSEKSFKWGVIGQGHLCYLGQLNSLKEMLHVIGGDVCGGQFRKQEWLNPGS